MMFMRYAGVGIIGTMVHFLILALLVEFMTAVAASTTGAIAGCVTNFRLAKAFVFTTRPADTVAFPRFATVAIGGIALNAAMMATLTPLLPVYVSQVAASAIVLMSGFLLNSAWTFSEYRS